MKKHLTVTFQIILFTQFLSAQITFEKVSDFAFNDDISYLRGISWVDVDNDFDLDVFISGSSGNPQTPTNESAIFLNDGFGNFTKSDLLVTDQIGTFTHGWADIENDGDLDVYIAATWNFGGINELWLNEGTGFSKVTNSGATPNTASPYEGTVSWGDYDSDGFVDLFLPRWNTQTNILYRNNGNGTFESMNLGALTSDNLWTSGGTWGDYDNDGDLDIYVYNYQNSGGTPGRNDLFENMGNGTFTKNTAAGDVVTHTHNTRTANWVDFNNDGLLDLFVANQSADNFLYRNLGNGTFSSQNISGSSTTWSSNWGDFDNDGDQDLIILGASPQESKFYANNGFGGMIDITNEHPEIFPLPFSGSLSNGIMFADYDNDGWLDLHITQPNTAPDFLFHNNGADCVSWIKIKPTGTESNWAAIGTTIRALANIEGNDVWQMRQISAQTSKPGQNSMWAHFGFGDAAIIDSLVFEWPSGAICAFSNVPVNQFIEVIEDCSINVIIAPPPIPGETFVHDPCEGADDFQLEVPSGNTNGIWSSNCGNCLDDSGFFAASTLPVGEYQAYYSDGGICGFRDTVFINIHPFPTLTVMPDTTVLEGTLVELWSVSSFGYSWAPWQDLSCDNCPNPIWLATETTDFTAYAISEYDCWVSDTMTITVVPVPEFEMPNAFTPDSDGINDVFNAVFEGDIFVSYHMKIYNRWGEMVFESDNPDIGWDGTDGSEPHPSDVYVYELIYEFTDGNSGKEKGDVTLLR